MRKESMGMMEAINRALAEKEWQPERKAAKRAKLIRARSDRVAVIRFNSLLWCMKQQNNSFCCAERVRSHQLANEYRRHRKRAARKKKTDEESRARRRRQQRGAEDKVEANEKMNLRKSISENYSHKYNAMRSTLCHSSQFFPLPSVRLPLAAFLFLFSEYHSQSH